VKPEKLFLVGDPKQAIYRFRRADVELYEQLKKRLVADGAKLLHLTTTDRAPRSTSPTISPKTSRRSDELHSFPRVNQRSHCST
jgi:ATP-dependent helicase/nuclease subunit A